MTVYELLVEPGIKKSRIVVCNSSTIAAHLDKYRALKKEESNIIKIDEGKYISLDKEALKVHQKTLECEYLKNKFLRVIRNYFNVKKIRYTEEESLSGSVYFTFKIPDFPHPVKIRVSNHAPYKTFASLSLRYDLHRADNRNLNKLIEKTLTDLINRKHYEKTKLAIESLS